MAVGSGGVEEKWRRGGFDRVGVTLTFERAPTRLLPAPRGTQVVAHQRAAEDDVPENRHLEVAIIRARISDEIGFVFQQCDRFTRSRRLTCGMRCAGYCHWLSRCWWICGLRETRHHLNVVDQDIGEVDGRRQIV